MARKIFDLVKELLTEHPSLRDSDKKLLWAVWWKKRLVQAQKPLAISRILYMDYMNAPSSESITRARRKVQEMYPELAATKPIEKRRRVKEQTKGTFIFNEEVGA